MQLSGTDIDDNLLLLLKIHNLSDEYKHFKFHHMGIATTDIESYFEDYKCISYKKNDYYTDEKLGVKCLFATHNTMPTLEIIENLPSGHFLDKYLKNFISIFHQAYLVDDLEYCCNILVDKLGSKLISDIYDSIYFKGQYCYIQTPDGFTIELIKDNRNIRL